VVEVRLPVVAAGHASTSAGSAVPAAGGSERILLAEDQPHLLLQVARLLKEAGYEVVAVANGAEAVTAAARQAFHLHVLDTVMPVMGGREACDRIRAERPGARFLFTSGYGGDALPAAFLEASGTELVPKPFDRQTLLHAVRRMLDRPGPGVASLAEDEQ
jgi:two-component system, cell cycle sensor histidine kinase and response regulator CckA